MRFYYIAVILAGIMLMLNIGGFITPTGSLVKSLGFIGGGSGTSNVGNLTIQNVKSSELWGSSSQSNTLVYLLTGLVTAGIVLGAFGRSPDPSYVQAGITFVITSLLVSDLVYIWNTLRGFNVFWITSLGAVLIGSLIVGVVITALQFWRGDE